MVNYLDRINIGFVGLISAVGLLGSVVSPAVIGVLRDMTGGFAAGLYYVAVLLVISMILSWIVTAKARAILRPGQ
jgi:MFS-type transporter involved in bile tolerance (Atg22 family)